ncbi:MAG: sugar transferase [Ruminococcus sp.]|nr:sugar transferase [Ruminococcus sp.]
MKTEQGSVIGNSALVSVNEERVAQLLREKNLDYVNSISKEVHPKNTLYTRAIKRLLDLIVSIPVFIVLLPFNAIFAVCTFFDVGSPIFYKQTRVGKNAKKFTMVKFRNMNEKKDADGRLLPPSQRVTKFGRIMRKFSLDELLNFWSIIKGDMSIIGPRPQPVFVYERLSDRHKHRSDVRPGLECPRMIHVEKEDIFRYQRTFENDVWYVENVSFATDCKMIFMLVKMVFSFKKRGNQASGNGITYFVGYDETGTAMSMKNYQNDYKSGNYDSAESESEKTNYEESVV